MSRLRGNIVANITGQVWFVLVSILCTPFLIKLLGVEAYGLIAFYALLQNLTQILDLGMGPTLNREMARSWSPDSNAGNGDELARFVATMERWYWILGSAIGSALFFLAPYIVVVWLRPEQLSVEEMSQSARLMGVLACLQWPIAFYQNCLLGMQRQVALNAFQVLFGSLSAIGGVVFVWLGPRSISGLLTWQVFVTLLQLLTMAGYFWVNVALPKNQLRVDLKALQGKWGFSLGMSGIAVTGLIITNVDKVILSRLLSLESFGHYTLAVTLARGLYVLMTPLFNAYFPRFSELVSAGDKDGLRLSYHGAAQLMAALSFPLAAIIALFSAEIAYLWLHDLKVAAEIAPLASLLVIGTCLNGLTAVPFALQLSYGRTSIALYINIFLVLILVPVTILAASHYGALGGAAMWAIVNGLCLLVAVPITHKYLLVGEAKAWLTSDILPPLLTSVLVVGSARMLIPQDQAAILSLLTLAFLWIFTTLCAAVSAGQVRKWCHHFVANLR